MHSVIAYPKAVSGTRLKIFDKYVCVGDEPFKIGQPLFYFQINNHTAFVSIGCHERRTFAVDEWRSETHIVAYFWAFNLNYIGALVRQDHRTIGAR